MGHIPQDDTFNLLDESAISEYREPEPISDLEPRITTLEQMNQILTETVKKLVQDNKDLKKENEKLGDLVKKLMHRMTEVEYQQAMKK